MSHSLIVSLLTTKGLRDLKLEYPALYGKTSDVRIFLLAEVGNEELDPKKFGLACTSSNAD